MRQHKRHVSLQDAVDGAGFVDLIVVGSDIVFEYTSDSEVIFASCIALDFLTFEDNALPLHWLQDRDATFHVTPYHDWFSSYSSSAMHGSVRLVDGSVHEIAGSGEVRLSLPSDASYLLRDVHHVPDLTMSLISIDQLKDSGCRGVEDKAQSIEQKEAIDIHPAPKHFKSYTTEDRRVVYTKAQRTPISGSSGVYDGPAIVKEIELAEPGEESKPVFIAQDLTEVEEAVLKELLKEFKDIFAWTYHDMKGVPPSMVQHTIPMISTAKPVQQRPYPMNPKYAKIVQEELEKLIQCGFIYPIEHSKWVSPIVIVPKKNGKLRVCVDLKKVNAATRRDHYPLPYSEHVLEQVAGKEAYSFLDGYSGYNQITIALEDQAKTIFITEFGVFAFRVMAWPNQCPCYISTINKYCLERVFKGLL
ncbi:hypothetical protein L7F22_061699 [Adiantum nelumboides]|nr:hypothetical protein [Adiantum nelumboides]